MITVMNKKQYDVPDKYNKLFDGIKDIIDDSTKWLDDSVFDIANIKDISLSRFDHVLKMMFEATGLQILCSETDFSNYFVGKYFELCNRLLHGEIEEDQQIIISYGEKKTEEVIFISNLKGVVKAALWLTYVNYIATYFTPCIEYDKFRGPS